MVCHKHRRSGVKNPTVLPLQNLITPPKKKSTHIHTGTTTASLQSAFLPPFPKCLISTEDNLVYTKPTTSLVLLQGSKSCIQPPQWHTVHRNQNKNVFISVQGAHNSKADTASTRNNEASINGSCNVPKVPIVKNNIAVPQIKEIIKTVPVKKIVKIEKQRIKTVPKIEISTIEKEIEMLGEIVKVPKPFLIENRVLVPRFVDTPVPTVVSQTLEPTFVECDDFTVEYRLKHYEPEIIFIDVFVPHIVGRKTVIQGLTSTSHVPVDIPLAHYNSLILKLNSKCQNHELSKDEKESNDTCNEDISQNTQSLSNDNTYMLAPVQMLISAETGASALLSEEPKVILPDDDWIPFYSENKSQIDSLARLIARHKNRKWVAVGKKYYKKHTSKHFSLP